MLSGLFGYNPSRPSSSYTSASGSETQNIIGKIGSVKKQFRDNQEALQEYSGKYKKLLEFAKTMSGGYVNSVQVIADISTLLTAYKDLFDEIAANLQAFDFTLRSELRKDEIEQLRRATQQNMDILKATFNSEYMKIRTMIQEVSANPSESVRHLDAVKDVIERTSDTAALRGGKRLTIVRRKVAVPKKKKAT